MENWRIWALPLAMLVGYLIVLGALVPLLFRFLRKKAGESENVLDDILLSALGKPITLSLIGIGLRLFLDAVPLTPELAKYGRACILFIFVAAAYFFFDNFLIEVLKRYSKRLEVIATSAGIVKTVFRLVVLGLIALIILDQLDITITPFMASLGIGGLVVALALQDTLGNLFSGMYIFFDKPIRIGDFVRLESGEEGHVTHIGWRNTRIRMLPNNTIIVPNNKITSSQIVNYYIPERQMSALVQVGVSYDSDLEHVERVTIEVGKEVLKDATGGVTEFTPFIRYHTFADFSINFTVILRVRDFVDKYLVTHEFIKRLHKRYKEEGIEIPFPIRTVHMEGVPKEPGT
jgi:small-conductance mechanosensitive channel